MKRYSSIDTPKGKFRYEKKFLYVGIKKIDRDLAFENLKELVPLLYDAGIKFGPVFGTLLGIVRENNFIEWDEDIDLYILKEQEEAFRSLLWDLRSAGFELVRYAKRGLYSVMKRGEYIDFYVMRPVSANIRTTSDSFMFDKYILDTVKYDFKGLMLDIPREYDEYLGIVYGDWRTPVKYADFEVSRSRIFFLKMVDNLKDALPDRLYSYMLKKYHAKDLQAFIRKCEEKGIPVDKDIRY